MPRTSETAFNVELANALRDKHPRWREGDRIGAERTGVFRDHLGLQPDIVVHHPGGAPVVVETEFEPARTAGRQQQGRAILTISGLPALPVLDVRTLDPRQLGIAARIFEDFRDWTFLPANEAYRDETRKALDRAVLCDLLGLPESILEPLDVLRAQWCAEPTVLHSGKSTRPT